MYTAQDVYDVVRTTGRLLVFRQAVPDLKRHAPLYLAFGAVLAWLAGIGRHWDNSRSDVWQHLGLGSVAYVFVFAFLLWLFLLPLKPANWQYRNVLIFVALTAPPAFLYVLPGRFLVPEAIPQAKAILLAAVATWRVALLARYLRRSAGLTGGRLIVALWLPLVLLVTALVVLNLDRAVFNAMGGGPYTPNDNAYKVLLVIDIISILLLPVLLIAYGWYSYRAWRPSAKQALAAA